VVAVAAAVSFAPVGCPPVTVQERIVADQATTTKRAVWGAVWPEVAVMLAGAAVCCIPTSVGLAPVPVVEVAVCVP
jgi:hypothetical protein